MWVSNKRDLLYGVQSRIRILLASFERKLVTKPRRACFQSPEHFNIVFIWLSKNQYQYNYSDHSYFRLVTMHRPITTAANSAINQSEFLAITRNLPKAREKLRVQGAIGFGFGFASQWLKNWREPITKCIHRNRVIYFRWWFQNCSIVTESSTHEGVLYLSSKQFHAKNWPFNASRKIRKTCSRSQRKLRTREECQFIHKVNKPWKWR